MKKQSAGRTSGLGHRCAVRAGRATRAVRATRGFTLLELLVVVAIIGMLAAYVGPKYFGVLGNTEQKSAKAQIKLLTDAVKLYRLDVGTYPTTQQGLNALLQQPGGVSGWKGPYLEKKGVPLDPWKKVYMYRFPGTEGRDFDVYSYGSDGQPGGADTAADVMD